MLAEKLLNDLNRVGTIPSAPSDNAGSTELFIFSDEMWNTELRWSVHVHQM